MMRPRYSRCTLSASFGDKDGPVPPSFQGDEYLPIQLTVSFSRTCWIPARTLSSFAISLEVVMKRPGQAPQTVPIDRPQGCCLDWPRAPELASAGEVYPLVAGYLLLLLDSVVPSPNRPRLFPSFSIPSSEFEVKYQLRLVLWGKRQQDNSDFRLAETVCPFELTPPPPPENTISHSQYCVADVQGGPVMTNFFRGEVEDIPRVWRVTCSRPTNLYKRNSSIPIAMRFGPLPSRDYCAVKPTSEAPWEEHTHTQAIVRVALQRYEKFRPYEQDAYFDSGDRVVAEDVVSSWGWIELCPMEGGECDVVLPLTSPEEGGWQYGQTMSTEEFFERREPQVTYAFSSSFRVIIDLVFLPVHADAMKEYLQTQEEKHGVRIPAQGSFTPPWHHVQEGGRSVSRQLFRQIFPSAQQFVHEGVYIGGRLDVDKQQLEG